MRIVVRRGAGRLGEKKTLQDLRLPEALEPTRLSSDHATPTSVLGRAPPAPGLAHHLRWLTSHYGTMCLCKLL